MITGNQTDMIGKEGTTRSYFLKFSCIDCSFFYEPNDKPTLV